MAAESGVTKTERYRDERQMIYIINRKKREDVLRYLEIKRAASFLA